MKKPKSQKPKKRFHFVAECLVRYRTSGVYFARIKRHGKQILRSLRTNDLALAKRLLVDFRRKHGSLDPARGKKLLSDLVKDYREEYASKSEKTREYKDMVTDRILGRWADKSGTQCKPLIKIDKPVVKIQRHHCVEWLNQFQIGAVSRNGHIAILKAIFAMAVENGVIVDSPIAKLKKEKVEKRLPETPTWDEFKRIVANIRAQKFADTAEESADFVDYLGRAGMGQAEAAALKWGDVDWQRGLIRTFRHKTKKGFRFPIYPWLRPLLEKLLEKRFGKGKQRNDERVFRVKDAKKAIASACRREGLPQYSHRGFRRMFITRAHVDLNIPAPTVAAWQGHTDGGALIARTYTQLRDEHSQRAAALLVDEEPENVVRMTKEGGAA